jgi:hypothetical protein
MATGKTNAGRSSQQMETVVGARQLSSLSIYPIDICTRQEAHLWHFQHVYYVADTSSSIFSEHILVVRMALDLGLNLNVVSGSSDDITAIHSLDAT